MKLSVEEEESLVEFVICDNCRIHSHIMVAKWIQLETSLILLCKKCQLDFSVDKRQSNQ